MRSAVTAVVIATQALVLASCGEEPAPPPRYPFTFSVHSDGDPLEGVPVTVNDAPVGTTNGEGVLRVDLTGPEGANVRVSVACPEGYRSPEPQVHGLRRIQSLDPATAARGIQVPFACPPERRNAVVVIRTYDQAGVPVVVDGRERARTDESGAAHLHFAMAPGTSFQVLLDTRHNEHLRPRSPTQTFTVPDQDEVFVVDQRFEEERPRRRRRRRARPASRPVRLPIRIPSQR